MLILLCITKADDDVHKIEEMWHHHKAIKKVYTLLQSEPDLTERIFEICSQIDTKDDLLFVDSDMQLDNESITSLIKSLEAAEKHGISIPKSDIKSILNVENIPLYHRVYFNDTICVMIKRRVYNLFWHLCDFTGYDSIYYQLKKFCLFISDYGYSTIQSNYAVLQIKNTNTIFDEKQEDLLNKQYPYLNKLEMLYERYDTSAVDHFSGLLVASKRKKKVLIDLFQVQPRYNGVNEHNLSLMSSFVKKYFEEYDIYVFIPPDADEYFLISAQGYKTISDETSEELFDIAIVGFHYINKKHLCYLNRCALKIIVFVHDIIMLRCNYVRCKIDEMDEGFRLLFSLIDGIVCVSDFSKNDLLAYFIDEYVLKDIEIIKIKNPPKLYRTEPVDIELPFDKYILVMGNALKHKMLNEVINEIRNNDNNFIIIGYGGDKLLYSNVYGYDSGSLENGFISLLYNNCDMVLFPSCYEGFGFPVYEALFADKPILLFDCELNHEHKEILQNNSENLYLFKIHNEINSLIEDILNNKHSITPIEWSWDKFVVELNKFVCMLMLKPINYDIIAGRWLLFKSLEHTIELNDNSIALYEDYRHNLEYIVDELRAKIGMLNYEIEDYKTYSDEMRAEIDTSSLTLNHLYSRFNDYKLFSLLRFSIIENIKHRHPKVYRLLKGRRG
ncbi:MAG: glycosyltransferase [Oscillospiraceae bacterium]|nr:glycosyltransferase [Oscillospiraceae bacterium]